MILTTIYAHVLGRLTTWRDDERGQATAEYALVLLGAAAIALLVVTWASKTGLVGKLLDTVLDDLLGRAKG